MAASITEIERHQQKPPTRRFGGAAASSISRQSETWHEDIRRVREARTGRSSVSDIALLYPETVVASSDTFGWQNIRVLHLRHNLNEVVVPPSDSHCLVLNLGTAILLEAQLDKRKFEGEVSGAEVAIIPAGSSWVCRSQSPPLSSIMLIYLRPLFVRSAVAEFNFSYTEIGLTPQIGFRNNQIHHLAMSLLQELDEANLVGRLYADSLAIGLAMQLVRRYSALQDVQIGHGGMAPHKLRKAVGIIDRHLAEEQEGRVALRAVAKDVSMSYFHFSRAFKQSMGMSPTNYIAERKIERAKELLNETELPISEIALRAGFASQSHFTSSFRRVAGSTPRDFRAAI